MLRGKGIDPADVDLSATDDDAKSADKNIIMQMRKAQSLRGKFAVEFLDKKKIKIPAKIAQAVTKKYNALRRPSEKQEFQARVSKSYKDMLTAVNESLQEDMTVTGAVSGGISQKDIDHVQKELRRLGVKDAVVGQNKMDKNKLDVKTKMDDAVVKKAFNKSKMTVTYEHIQLEGTWTLPDTPKQKAALKKLLSKPLKAKDATDKLYALIGDDDMFDDLDDYSDREPNDDVRPMVKSHMKRLGIKEDTILDRIAIKIQERKNG
jgi:hypothetical protein